MEYPLAASTESNQLQLYRGAPFRETSQEQLKTEEEKSVLIHLTHHYSAIKQL